MIKIAICDDEQNMVLMIQKMILKSSLIHDGRVIQEGGIVTDGYCDGNSLLTAIGEGSIYDLIYLDIEMPGMDGIELARKIRALDEHVLLIYVSSHEKYMIDLFEVSPFRFIRKPVEWEVFEKIFEVAMNKIFEGQFYFEYVNGWTDCRILLKDILYFESSRRQIIIMGVKGKETFYGKLDEIENKILEMQRRFIRVHQSFLVNPDKIVKMGAGKVELLNGDMLPISKKRQQEVNQQYLRQYMV